MRRAIGLVIVLLNVAAFTLLPSARADIEFGKFGGSAVGGGASTSGTNTFTGSNTFAGSAGATLGSDMVTNGTFTGGATGWTLGGGGGAPDWAYSGANNVTHASGGGTATLTPSTPLTVVAASAYKICFTLSAFTGGTVTPNIGGTNGSPFAANGTYCSVIVATNTNNLIFTPTNTLAATLDTVTVQLLTAQTSNFVLEDGTTDQSFRTGPPSSRNFCIGDQGECAFLSTGSSNNTCIGGLGCLFLTSGTSNAFYGASAGQNVSDGIQNTGVGSGALAGVKTGDRNACVGVNCMQNQGASFNNSDAACIGNGCLNLVTGDFNAALGSTAGNTTNTGSYSIALGAGSDFVTSNQLVIGGDDSASHGITTAYIGRGVNNSAPPTTVTWNGTGGSGSNIAGTTLVFAGGVSTGTATAGDFVVQRTPTVQSSGSTANTKREAMRIVSKARTLTDATATTLIQVGGLGAHTQAGGQIDFTASATDGTNDQATSGSLWWSCVDTTAGAGGETAGAGLSGTNVSAVSTGTLTCTVATTTGTDLCNVQLSCDTSLTATVLEAHYVSTTNCRTCTVTPQ